MAMGHGPGFRCPALERLGSHRPNCWLNRTGRPKPLSRPCAIYGSLRVSAGWTSDWRAHTYFSAPFIAIRDTAPKRGLHDSRSYNLGETARAVTCSSFSSDLTFDRTLVR